MTAPSRRTPALLVLLAVLVAATPGCRGDTESDDLPVDIELRIAPTPPVVGPALVIAELRDEETGEAVDGAEVRFEGTMSHAGMVPVHADAEERQPGHYRVDAFDFTMGGDWIFRVHAVLPDGTSGTRSFDVQVVSTPGDDDGGS